MEGDKVIVTAHFELTFRKKFTDAEMLEVTTTLAHNSSRAIQQLYPFDIPMETPVGSCIPGPVLTIVQPYPKREGKVETVLDPDALRRFIDGGL
jgi:hypothetical protein